MKLFYAERLGDTDKGEPYIAERGIFLSIEEFASYRLAGWSGTKENNVAADEYIAAMKTHNAALTRGAEAGTTERG